MIIFQSLLDKESVREALGRGPWSWFYLEILIYYCSALQHSHHSYISMSDSDWSLSSHCCTRAPAAQIWSSSLGIFNQHSLLYKWITLETVKNRIFDSLNTWELSETAVKTNTDEGTGDDEGCCMMKIRLINLTPLILTSLSTASWLTLLHHLLIIDTIWQLKQLQINT